MKYVLYNPSKNMFFHGFDKNSLVNAACNFTFNSEGELIVQVHGYEKTKYHTYTKEWTTSERYEDAIKFIFGILTKNYNCSIFKNINY